DSGRETFWSRVRESLRGERHDYTSLPLGRAILLLAVPMVLEMAMESVFALADIFWVSKLGPDAIATVAFTESMLIIVYSFVMGLAIGASARLLRVSVVRGRGSGRWAVRPPPHRRKGSRRGRARRRAGGRARCRAG